MKQGKKAMALAVGLAVMLAAVPGWTQAGLFVATSDFSTGSTAYLAPGATTAQVNLLTIHPDAVVRYHDGRVYIINRLGQDNIIVLDPAGPTVPVVQFSVGSGANPQDIAIVSPSKAYVSRYDSAELLIVDPQSGAHLGTIDLSDFADDDGLPEMAALAVVGSRVYVALQRLDRDEWFSPAGVSYLAVIDAETDRLVDVDPATPGVQGIALTVPNPGTLIPMGTKIAVSAVGFYGVLDGGIELVDTQTNRSIGLAVTEETLGGDVGAIAMVSDTRGYAVVSDENFVNSVKPFDLATGAVGEPLTGLSGGYLQTLAFDGERLIVGDRGSWTDPAAAGLMLYEAATGALLHGPVSTGLPPSSIAVLRDPERPTAVVEASGAALPEAVVLGAAYPNPFNAATLIPFEIDQTATVELTVYDLLGRPVRSLLHGALAPGFYTVTWDGRDDRETAVGNGVYFVELRLGRWRDSRKVMLLK